MAVCRCGDGKQGKPLPLQRCSTHTEARVYAFVDSRKCLNVMLLTMQVEADTERDINAAAFRIPFFIRCNWLLPQMCKHQLQAFYGKQCVRVCFML